jgi:hypothetical protein
LLPLGILSQSEKPPCNLGGADSLSPLEFFKGISIFEHLYNIMSITINDGVIAMCVELAVNLLECVKGGGVLHLAPELINELAMSQNLSPLFTGENHWTFVHD